ncbi:MAG: hypothetical protein KKC84_03470, partial [Candidatus Omnitrophica bacterium]|nr:hypothetical protein [Candidatus Omnitrophota bacterium]
MPIRNIRYPRYGVAPLIFLSVFFQAIAVYSQEFPSNEVRQEAEKITQRKQAELYSAEGIEKQNSNDLLEAMTLHSKAIEVDP